MSKERVVTFTDAVLAIIMTILVLELDEPDTPDIAGLIALRENYFAYAISFFWLGNLWISSNRQWEGVEKVTSSMLFWTIVMLFFASLIPYVTDYCGKNFYNIFAQCFYGVIVILVSVSDLLLNYSIARANESDKELYDRVMLTDRWILEDIIFKCIGILLAIFIWPPLSAIFIIISSFLPSLRDVLKKR